MDRPTTLPGRDRPGVDQGRPGFVGKDRPGIADKGRPGLPGKDRPGIVDKDRPVRPGSINRPDWSNRPAIGNAVINKRPAWANIDNSVNVNINNRWNKAFVNAGNNQWWHRPSNRLGYWGGWGNDVRRNWSHYHDYRRWYGKDWWHGHPHALCPWHYHYRWGRYPASYWWRRATWVGLGSWFVWSTASPVIWQEPIYYDYGAGGNVTYQNNMVYVGGEQVATTTQFAQSAADLATVPPPASEADAEAAEWMPLGTFTLTTGDKDLDPARTVQLAVSKEGIISGTLFNADTDQAQGIQGKVDKETQRVAMRFGENDTVVIETGIYNLTQDEVPLLVHFGTERTENWMLVRLEGEDDAKAESKP